jgi:hypothetical protein
MAAGPAAGGGDQDWRGLRELQVRAPIRVCSSGYRASGSALDAAVRLTRIGQGRVGTGFPVIGVCAGGHPTERRGRGGLLWSGDGLGRREPLSTY